LAQRCCNHPLGDDQLACLKSDLPLSHNALSLELRVSSNSSLPCIGASGNMEFIEPWDQYRHTSSRDTANAVCIINVAMRRACLSGGLFELGRQRPLPYAKGYWLTIRLAVDLRFGKAIYAAPT
jgi:hypothetical protein